MAKNRDMAVATPNAVQKVGVGQMPTFMRREGPVKSTQALKEFVVVPRLKVIQKSAGENIRKVGGTGDIILSPLNVLLAKIGRDPGGNPDKLGTPITFVPLYFFVDWATWNPWDMRGSLPAIAYQTNDPKDPVVQKSRVKELRQEPLLGPDKKQVFANGKPQFLRHVEQLNFIIQAIGEDMPGEPFIVTFAKGEHFSGSKFSGLIRMRNAEIYGCVFQLRSAFRPDRGSGDWYGIDVENPPEDVGGWVTDEAEFKRYEELNAGFEKMYAERGIRADMSDADDLQGANEGGEGAPVNPATRDM